MQFPPRVLEILQEGNGLELVIGPCKAFQLACHLLQALADDKRVELQ